MNLSKKILISSVVTSLISILLVGSSIYVIVGNAVLNSVENNLKFQSVIFAEAYSSAGNNIDSYQSFIDSINDSYDLRGIHTLFYYCEDDAAYKVVSTSGEFEHSFAINNVDFFLSQEAGKIYNLDIGDQTYIVYNSYIHNNNHTHDDLLISVTDIDIVGATRKEIAYSLFNVVLVAILLSSLITIYIQNKINEPINILLKATEDIGMKNFSNKIDIKTNDEFKVLGDAINTMSGNLRKRDEEQRLFYETISHELKTPVAVISGYIEGIQSGIIEDVDKTHGIVIEECTRLKKQLENVIYLSKLDTLSDSYNFEYIDINTIIISSLKKVESVVIINEIDVIFEPIQEIVAEVDREKIERVFINILYNCIKYTSDEIFVSADEFDDFIEVKIKDNGVGFPPQILEKPFDGKVIGEKDGTGLGLKIIKKIIDVHKGTIVLTNDKEIGATYIVRLPISRK
ncbi:MAG: ATP-binding protein [Lachnospirales bacterium]